ncbi:ubiquinone biosynthesis methyltransferase UbiE, partial [Mesorhizobium sp. M00.F.Ca.ET.149.01.1.1]
ETAVDYNATLRVEEAEGDAVKLVVDLPLEGLQH